MPRTTGVWKGDVMNNIQEHPDIDTMTQLHQGRLSLRETAMFNKHKAVCAECRDAYYRIADLDQEREHSGDQASRFQRLFSQYRHQAEDEMRLSIPNPLDIPLTALDRIFSILNAESSQFMVTPGKLESLTETIRQSVDKLDQDPWFSPEGERSFVSFLTRCVEEISLGLAQDRESVELNMFSEMLSSLGKMASGEALGLEGEEAFRDTKEAFEDTVSNIFNALKKQVGGA